MAKKIKNAENLSKMAKNMRKMSFSEKSGRPPCQISKKSDKGFREVLARAGLGMFLTKKGLT